VRTMPPLGSRAPFVYFVSGKHLEDIDAHGDLLDVFDILRLLRRAAWGEPVAFEEALHSSGVGDLGPAVAALLRPLLGANADRAIARIESDERTARIVFSDASSITVPRIWHSRITDAEVTPGIGSALMTSRRSLRELNVGPADEKATSNCLHSVEVGVNRVFYRLEPHMMQRYMALALDNIRSDPIGFALASAYRSVRVFIIAGASDTFTAQQFSQSRSIYSVGMAVSVIYLVLCGAGIVIGLRRGDNLALPLVLIAYVPLTLAPVLINMRYTVTIQPLMFVFMAIALSSMARLNRRFYGRSEGEQAAAHRAGT